LLFLWDTRPGVIHPQHGLLPIGPQADLHLRAGTDLRSDLAGCPHRRRLGLHREARHAEPLARRPGAGLPGGRQRQRHAGLKGGARVLVVSNEHPEILERTKPRAEDEATVRDAMRRLRGAQRMHVSSPAGTDLAIGLQGARVGGVWGFTAQPGTLTHWPAGLVLAFPAAGSVNGTLVLAPGDVNLTFKRYLADAVPLRIERDHVVSVEGTSVDAELMRGYFAAWNDPGAYAVSHVGWGLNRGARWDAMTFYDKADFNGTELRAFAGNFLYSTGANEVAGRHTLGHFDLPMRGCTVTLDGEAVVREGVLL